MRRTAILSLIALLGAGCAGEPPSREYAPQFSFEDVSSSQDGVSLTWFVLDATFRTAGNDLISPKAISHFELEREDVASGTWTCIAHKIPASARNYVDRNLKAGLQVRYNLTMAAVDGTTASVDTEEPVNGPVLWTFDFSVPREGKRGTVVIRIRKFEKGVGQVELTHTQMEGEYIGRWDHTFTHPVTLASGISREVDFNTGAQLGSIAQVILEVDTQRCKSVFERDGTWIGCTRLFERRTFLTHRITYEDQEGDHELHVPPPDRLNRICELHRENPGLVEIDRRLLEARMLLDDADALWDTDSAASIALYQRLLKDYRDVVIRLQVRNRVEGRARQAEDK